LTISLFIAASLLVFGASSKDWIGLNELQPTQWTNLYIFGWWNMMAREGMPSHKVIASITLLVAWEVWN
jgi:hypothetical protein